MRITSLMQQSVAIRRLSSTLLRKISSPINNIPSVISRATMATAPTVTNATPIGMAPSISEQAPEHNHAKQFILERIWAVGMLPILPAAYFIHTPGMDFILSIALVMHVHWGVHGVVYDYARPIVIGETMTKVSHMLVYAMTVLLFAGLMHFNYNDVGLTKAFEMVWTL